MEKCGIIQIGYDDYYNNYYTVEEKIRTTRLDFSTSDFEFKLFAEYTTSNLHTMQQVEANLDFSFRNSPSPSLRYLIKYVNQNMH